MVPVTVCFGRYDRRLLAGANVWSKPFKSALSLTIHFVTFAPIAYFLPEEERHSTWMVMTAAGVAISKAENEKLKAPAGKLDAKAGGSKL